MFWKASQLSCCGTIFPMLLSSLLWAPRLPLAFYWWGWSTHSFACGALSEEKTHRGSLPLKLASLQLWWCNSKWTNIWYYQSHPPPTGFLYMWLQQKPAWGSLDWAWDRNINIALWERLAIEETSMNQSDRVSRWLESRRESSREKSLCGKTILQGISTCSTVHWGRPQYRTLHNWNTQQSQSCSPSPFSRTLLVPLSSVARMYLPR